jgi:hypothetical protein
MSALTAVPRRPVLLLVDIEPDLRRTRAGEGGWEGTRAALPCIARLRRELEAATDTRVVFNWFFRLDPQIRDTWGRADWVAEACPELLRSIAEHGDACGIHPHLWSFDSRRADWRNAFGEPEWTQECLATSVAAFERLFGEPPMACRFGDRWLDDDAVRRIREAGLRFDLTVEPGLPATRLADDPGATRLPDTRRAPREPWRPAPGDYLRPLAGELRADDLWMLPLTCSPPVWRLVRRPPYLMRASWPPNLALASARIWPFLAAELDRPTRAPLVLVFRAGDFAQPRFAANFRRTAAALARHPALARCSFTDPPHALASFLAA